MNYLIAALLLIASMANAATWERPAGAYTPTNHSVNITKYQQLSAARGGIPSASVDGDLNKAFQGLNDLESRTAPSVTGHSNTVLFTDGSSSKWGLVSTTLMSSGLAPAGRVLVANGVGGVNYQQLTSGSIPPSGVTAGSYTFPNIIVDASGFVTSATSNATPTVTGLTAGTITATQINVGVLSATTINGPVGWNLISTQTASSSTSLTFVLPSTYTAFKFVVNGLTVGTNNVTLQLVASVDGTNFLAGTNYSWWNSNLSGANGGSSTGSFFQLTPQNQSNAANASFSAEVGLFNPTNAVYRKVSVVGSYNNQADGVDLATLGAGAIKTSGTLVLARFQPSSGNFGAGTVQLYGIK